MAVTTWGPDARPAAASITFDNLGEAADLGRGRWPEGEPLGEHPTVLEYLPKVLDVLAGKDLRATFFVESFNATLYPEALRGIAEDHDLGCHAYQHEAWGALPEDEQRAILGRSMDLFREIDVDVRGFRPPGGGLTGGSLPILRAAGIEYVSAAGGAAGRTDGVALLPFRWDTIDGTYHFPHLRRPPSTVVLGPDDMLAAYRTVADETVAAHGYVSFIFHPMWLDTPDRLATLARLVDQLRADDRLWLASCGEVSDFLRATSPR
ncbi:polysaccharide deacetylase family protein [Amycolatopsis sp. NPDC051903]|uniref:polysaccharide deacetylase family protein n=1 Tax=Amycolatopsis sp. NPDC051903 TaxID=3363936 RepID=UPI003796AAF7